VQQQHRKQVETKPSQQQALLQQPLVTPALQPQALEG
jgi:hypothetical protein